MIMINLNLSYKCYRYVRKAISWIVGNHCIYSYYNNNNSYWSKSKALTTSTPCAPWRSQWTTTHKRIVDQSTSNEHGSNITTVRLSVLAIWYQLITPLNPHILWLSDTYLLTCCIYSHYEQLLLFLSVLSILINF